MGLIEKFIASEFSHKDINFGVIILFKHLGNVMIWLVNRVHADGKYF
jgi:hypothetical protein